MATGDIDYKTETIVCPGIRIALNLNSIQIVPGIGMLLSFNSGETRRKVFFLLLYQTPTLKIFITSFNSENRIKSILSELKRKFPSTLQN